MSNRPTDLDNFIGQEHLVDNLRVILGAAHHRHEPAPHMLFMGPPGLGKTSLAEVIAAEMGTQITRALGTMLTKPAEMAALLAGLNEGDVLFIDEIHAVPRAVYETLYTAVEDFRLDIIMGGRRRPTPVSISLPRFTLVGATTHPGGISGPLRDRFGFTGKLEFYTPDELALIIVQAANRDNLTIDLNARRILANASRGTPRVAITLYERARDIAQSRGSSRLFIDDIVAYRALDLAGVNPQGLTTTDRSVLEALKKAGYPVGLTTLAASLGEEPSTLENMVEPYLLRMGLILRQPGGRIITQAGVEALRHG